VLDLRINSLILRGTKARAETNTYQKHHIHWKTQQRGDNQVPIEKKKRSTKGVSFIFFAT